MSYEPLIEVRRGALIESVHHGSIVVLDPAGAVVLSLGDVSGPVYPRSAVKPLQAAAMVAAGCPIRGPWLALAASSHSGEPVHVATALDVLSSVGLSIADLANEPDLPLGDAARFDFVRAGGVADRIHQNCSGKHAAMLATCVANGWSTAGYLDPAHPVQMAIRGGIETWAGEASRDLTTDGCGAPLVAISLIGLARAFAGIAAAEPSTSGGEVAAAMQSHPRLVGGSGRDVSELLEAIPGCVAKDGAEGVYAVGLASGAAVAVKIADGGPRGRLPAVLAGLAHLGVRPRVPVPPVLGGGLPVGELRATF